MTTSTKTLVDLETKFWQSMVDQDADTAVGLLVEPAVMVSSHGAFQFDHAAYRKMGDQGPMVVTSFEFEDMQVLFPTDTTAVLTYAVKQGVAPRDKTASTFQKMHDTSTWVRVGSDWKCVMHTESPAEAKPGK